MHKEKNRDHTCCSVSWTTLSTSFMVSWTVCSTCSTISWTVVSTCCSVDSGLCASRFSGGITSISSICLTNSSTACDRYGSLITFGILVCSMLQSYLPSKLWDAPMRPLTKNVTMIIPVFPSSHVKAVEVNGTSSAELLSSSGAIREGSLSSQPLGVVCKHSRLFKLFRSRPLEKTS